MSILLVLKALEVGSSPDRPIKQIDLAKMVNDLGGELNVDIWCDRKTMGRHIKLLSAAGYKIVFNKGKGYYLESSNFDLHETELLKKNYCRIEHLGRKKASAGSKTDQPTTQPNKNIHQKIFTRGNKMKENFTELLLIIDESGSMQSLRKETLEELNNFIKEQQEQDGETRLTVIFFNTRINVVYERVDINSVGPLDESFYRPNGMTALLDAIGTGIDALGDTLNKIPEPERPSKVLVAIMTDGMENASKLYSRTKIREMITHQTEKYSWEFNFLAANIDAKETAMSMGIDSERATQFDANVDGLHACFCAMRRMTATTRKPTKCI